METKIFFNHFISAIENKMLTNGQESLILINKIEYFSGGTSSNSTCANGASSCDNSINRTCTNKSDTKCANSINKRKCEVSSISLSN